MLDIWQKILHILRSKRAQSERDNKACSLPRPKPADSYTVGIDIAKATDYTVKVYYGSYEDFLK